MIAAGGETAYPHLFSPFKLAGFELRNRIVHASMSTRYVTAGKVTERLITYHRTRARGGASLLVTEPLNLLPRQRNPQKVMVLDETNREGLARWAAASATTARSSCAPMAACAVTTSCWTKHR